MPRIFQQSAVVITRYLTTLSRLAIIDVNAFMELLNRAASKLGVSPEETLKKLIAEWLDRVGGSSSDYYLLKSLLG